jgi:peptidoglycan/LPS O-acetylase OafA/YrhL
VISGFLITRLLHDELLASGRIDFVDFYARRARRILPAFIVVVLATLAISAVTFTDPGDVAKSAAAASGFVANIYFQLHTGGYWSAGADTMPLLHMWSLSVEEQFYLAWPIFLLLTRKKPVTSLLVLAACSLAMSEWWVYHDPQAAFFQMPSRAWELAVGGLVALRPMSVPRWSANAGLAMVVLACFVPFAHFPGLGALPAVFASALLLTGIVNGDSPFLLTRRPVVFIGLVSYSFYLWHWPIFAIAKAVSINDASLVERMVLLVLSFVLAAISYRFVERPFRRSRARSRRVVAVGAACLVALSCAAFAMPRPTRDAATIAAHDYPANRFECHQHDDDPVTFPEKCQTRRGQPQVVMWGDSMALAWQPFVYAMAGAHVGVSFSRDDCPPLLGYSGNEGCALFNRGALLRAQHAQTVILTSAWLDRFRPDKAAASERELDATLASLKGKQVYIIGPSPELDEPAPKCIHLRQACAMSRAEFDRRSSAADATLRRLAARHRAHYVETTEFFCNPDCTATRDGYALYWDNRHVSTTAAKAFAQRYLSTDR